MMAFHWSLSDSKSPQVSKTLLSILADPNDAIVWMVSTRPLFSNSSSPFTNPLVTIPSAPNTIGITVIFMSHIFSVLKQGLGTYLSFCFLSILHCDLPGRKLHNSAGSFFFLLTITRSGRLVEIRWSDYISKSQKTLCVSFSRTDFGLCIYHLLVWSNLNFFHNSQ